MTTNIPAYDQASLYKIRRYFDEYPDPEISEKFAWLIKNVFFNTSTQHANKTVQKTLERVPTKCKPEVVLTVFIFILLRDTNAVESILGHQIPRNAKSNLNIHKKHDLAIQILEYRLNMKLEMGKLFSATW